MAVFDWQLNRYQLHTYLELNDMGLVNLSVWQIITIKDELNHDVNTFSKGKSKTCGNKMSLRYSYGRYLRNAHRNAKAEAHFISHARNHGFTGQFHRYLLTVNPKLMSAYEPFNHYERSQMSASNDFRNLRHDLIGKNKQTLHRLTKINASEVARLRRNPKIAVIEMGIGRPYEAVHGSVRLMYHLHYSLLTTGRINKRDVARTAKSGRNWSVKLTDHGTTGEPDHNDEQDQSHDDDDDDDYSAEQDVNGTGNPAPADSNSDSGQSKWNAKKSRQTRMFMSAFHRCPVALAEAMTCYYYDHTVQNRLYWNTNNKQTKSYRHFCKCYEWLLNTIATLDFDWVNDCTRNKQSRTDYARAIKALADYRKIISDIQSFVTVPSAKDVLVRYILNDTTSISPTHAKPVMTGILKNSTYTSNRGRGHYSAHKMNQKMIHKSIFYSLNRVNGTKETVQSSQQVKHRTDYRLTNYVCNNSPPIRENSLKLTKIHTKRTSSSHYRS